MKFRFLFCLTLLLTPFYPVAQSYLSIPSTGALWKLQFTYGDIGPPPVFTTSIYHQITTGDTIIDSLPVIHVELGAGFVCGSPGSGAFTLHNPHEYIFQDTSTGKVWRKVPGDTLTLLFDFSAMPGDTVLIVPVFAAIMPSPPVTMLVDSVDTVTYADGIPRKRLYLTGDGFFGTMGMVVWVEGIGDIYHGLLPGQDFEWDAHAMCYREFGLDLSDCWSPFSPYVPCTGTACDILMEMETRTAMRSFILSPNPSGSLSFNSELSPGTTISIFSMNGKLVLRMNEAGLDKSQHLPAGTYLVLLQGEHIFQKEIWIKPE